MLEVVHPDGTREPAIRKLTKEEEATFASAAVNATSYWRAWRDAVALLRPFYDATCQTAYVDRHGRMGLGAWFFGLQRMEQRASVILHEASHMLNNHFVRGESLGGDQRTQNIAQDFEINTALEDLDHVDLSVGVFPDKTPFTYPRYKSFEQYMHYLQNDPNFQKPDPQDGEGEGEGEGEGDGQGQGQGQGSGSPSDSGGDGNGQSGDSSSGGGSSKGDKQGNSSGKQSGGKGDKHSPCDTATDARSEGADEAGVERASATEQTIAKKNTAHRIAEEAKRARAQGNGTAANALDFLVKQMQPPKVNWRDILRRVVAGASAAVVRGRSDYSYRRVSRRMSGSQYIFPGMVQYMPKMMFGIDTSGSMSPEDHLRAAQEVEGIIKAANRSKGGLSIFSVDTQVKNIKLVDSVAKLDLRGGGGTRMEVAFDYVNSLGKKAPDIFVLATDGYTDWDALANSAREGQRRYHSVVLVTTSGGYGQVPEDLKRWLTVIDISEGED